MDESTFKLGMLGIPVALLLSYGVWYKTQPVHPLPPRPNHYPIIGDLLSIPTENQHIGFLEIGKQLKRSMYCLKAFGATIIVLNSLEDAANLLEKRSSIYSDRTLPTMVTHPSLLNWGAVVALLGYNDRWKKCRKLMHPWLNKKAVEVFYPTQQHQARLLLQRLLLSSDSLNTSDQLDAEFTLATILAQSIYGYSVKSLNDPFVQNFKIATDNLAEASLPSNFLVNAFPAMTYIPAWFPGAGWKRTAQEWRKQQEQTVDAWYYWAKSKILAGEGENSIISSLMADAKELGLDADEVDDYVKQIAITLMIGGIDTSSSAALAFFSAMVQFPEIQAKAQREIDGVTAADRLPTLDDRPQLPYVGRLFEEVLRWCPPVPSGFPHACFKDDLYKRYRIPKGATIHSVGNIWAINYDSNIYKDPEAFDPDRFLDPNVPLSSTFGFGRRLCPGIHYAHAALFIMIASVLATFDITPSPDHTAEAVQQNKVKESAKINLFVDLQPL
ncbi:cytochrome P450 family protein [Ceratobasidium sp. AG-Ba]|nr:cytochrome P450 family protein [Ceratobasidium sp. AG-Ba]